MFSTLFSCQFQSAKTESEFSADFVYDLVNLSIRYPLTTFTLSVVACLILLGYCGVIQVIISIKVLHPIAVVSIKF